MTETTTRTAKRRRCACKAHIGRHCPVPAVRGSRYCERCLPVEAELRAMAGDR